MAYGWQDFFPAWRSLAQGSLPMLSCMHCLVECSSAHMPLTDRPCSDEACRATGAAFKLYLKASQAGSIEGMYSLGWMHAAGQGTPANTSRAAQLYRQAVVKAPDWRHAAPPFAALLLLPFLAAYQWLQQLTRAAGSSEVPGELDAC